MAGTHACDALEGRAPDRRVRSSVSGTVQSFPVQSDEHLLTVLRYIEWNAAGSRVVAGGATGAGQWPGTETGWNSGLGGPRGLLPWGSRRSGGSGFSLIRLLILMSSRRDGSLSESGLLSRTRRRDRCCFMYTVPGFDAPAMCPSNGVMTWRPLPSTGSLGMVPPLQRYYGTLPLPAVHLDPFEFLHEPIPSCRPWFAPLGRGRPTGGQGVVGSGLPDPD